MSRRTIIEEEFDDDTDLPLPSSTLPNLGTKGAILEALSDDDDEQGDSGPGSASGPATPSHTQFKSTHASSDMAFNEVKDITPYKKWICVYPIYIDAKRAYGTGERRIPRAKAVWWPLSRDIAEAASRLGLGVLHEAQKSHPRDWENPGRVRVQWKKEGRLVNPRIQSKKQLLELIAMQIQMAKPDNIPKPPYSTTTDAPTEPAPAPSPAKGKQPASKTAGKVATSMSPSTAPTRPLDGRLPVPPAPHPPLANRVSPYSPALVSGVLVETVKAGMSTPDAGLGALGGGGKGKRKVVRVRG